MSNSDAVPPGPAAPTAERTAAEQPTPQPADSPAGTSASTWLGPRVVILALVFCALVWWTGRPPRPRSAGTPDTEFSSARAMEHLKVIAAAPHPVGSAEHTRVREYLVAQLEALGLATEVQETTALIRAGSTARAATVRNVLARLPGTDSTGAIALVAHYDSVVLAPGAADDGSGVVAILEAARALLAGPALRNDLLLILPDAEELGLMGAQAFVAEHPWMEELALVINLEARGAAGPSIMFENGPDNGWVVRQYAEADTHPVGNSLAEEVYRYLPNDTDFSRFSEVGKIGLNFGFIEDAHRYHMASDTPANLSEASLQHHGVHTLSLARHFGMLDLSSTSAPPVTFFDFPLLGVVVYPRSWILPLNAVYLLALTVVLFFALRARRARPRGLIVGFLVALVSALVSAGLSYLMFLWVRGFHPEIGGLVGRLLYTEHWYLLSSLGLAVATVAALYGWMRRWFRPGELALGAVLLASVGLVLSAIWAPLGNWAYLWPAAYGLAAAVAALRWSVERESRWADVWLCLLLGAPALVFLTDMSWMLFVALSISAVHMIAFAAVEYLSLLFPLLELTGRPNRWWLPLVALLAAVLFLVTGVITTGTDDGRPAPSTLLYVVNRDLGSAVWASTQPTNDGWVERFVGSEMEWQGLDHMIPGAQRRYRVAEAVVLEAELAGAEVAVLEDTSAGGVRNVRVAIRSRIGAELLELEPVSPDSIELLSVNGAPLSSAYLYSEEEGPMYGEWRLQHWGVPVDGVVLELRTSAADEPIELVLLETVHRLPQLPGGPGISRPPHLTAHGNSLTDRAIYRQALVF